MNYRRLWLRWVGANAVGEMLGLGLTFAVGGMLITRLGDQADVILILAAFAIAVGSGAIEASIVGLAQWWAMHPWFPSINRRDWWLATLVGALIAYVMGYLPPTLMNFGEQAAPSQAPAAETAQWIVLLLAGGLGLVGGAVLSFAQWLTMRRTVTRASLWIPANMLAWLAGMPVIFWGIDVAQRLEGLTLQVLFMAVVLLFTGAVVGAIHGAFLVQIARAQESANPESGSIIPPF